MDKILVLGAGFVAGPLVRYFLNRKGTSVRVADLDPGRAKALVGKHPSGEAFALDLADEPQLGREIAAADIVVSLVPVRVPSGGRPPLHRRGEAHDHDLVRLRTPCGSSMPRRNGPASFSSTRSVSIRGSTIWKRCGSSTEVHGEGGRVLGFISYCGGIPAPESNTNPFGYKFSWSPRGVLLAGKSAARYLKDGKEVFVPGEDLFESCTMVSVEGLGEFEAYPNRNSIPYIDLYGIPETRTMLRGTLRYPGWCETLKKIAEIGLLDASEKNLAGLTALKFIRGLLGMPVDWNVKKAIRDRFKLETQSPRPPRMARAVRRRAAGAGDGGGDRRPRDAHGEQAPVYGEGARHGGSPPRFPRRNPGRETGKDHLDAHRLRRPRGRIGHGPDRGLPGRGRGPARPGGQGRA